MQGRTPVIVETSSGVLIYYDLVLSPELRNKVRDCVFISSNKQGREMNLLPLTFSLYILALLPRQGRNDSIARVLFKAGLCGTAYLLLITVPMNRSVCGGALCCSL